MIDPAEPGDRMRSAAALLDSLAGESSPLPWTYYEDHGRDSSGEGFSHVGLIDANGMQHVHTHGPGYEGNGQPELDAALMTVLSAAPAALAHLLREMADHYDTDPADGTCNAAALALADALLDRVGPGRSGRTPPLRGDNVKNQCPECRNGKSINCTGWALDAQTDEVIPCDGV